MKRATKAIKDKVTQTWHDPKLEAIFTKAERVCFVFFIAVTFVIYLTEEL